jgi:hypothetical protein
MMLKTLRRFDRGQFAFNRAIVDFTDRRIFRDD